MEDQIEDPTSTYEHQSTKKILHRPAKCSQKSRRGSYFKSYKYADIGFTITKHNKKYLAHCVVCNKSLGNTAFSRLKGHRNICKDPSSENGVDCSLYSFNNESLMTDQSNSSLQNFNVKVPKIEQLECEPSGNGLRYFNSNQESQLLDEDNQSNLNMIEVLLPIKYNKQILFGDETLKGSDMWLQVLKKAQCLGLAPSDVPWAYVRDNLYSAWRALTLKKQEAIEAGSSNVKYNIVDLCILQIESTPTSIDNSNPSSENTNLNEITNCTESGNKSTEENSQSSENNVASSDITISKSTQSSDKMLEIDLKLKMLQCEALEIENYKRSLEVLELERKLQVPHSKNVVQYFPALGSRAGVDTSRGRILLENTNNMCKIEIDG